MYLRIFAVFMSGDEVILERIYREVVAICKCSEALKHIIIPKEELRNKKLNELKIGERSLKRDYFLR